MPPKEGKKSPRAEKDLLEEEHQLNEDIIKISLRLSALKSHHFSRLEEIAISRQDRDELRSCCARCENDLHSVNVDRVDILTDYARQYKTEENVKVLACIQLDATLNRLEEEKIKLSEELKKTEAEYEGAINATRVEHDSLLARISELEREFSVIMDDTQTRTPHDWSG